jgi:hypothetical protein
VLPGFQPSTVVLNDGGSARPLRKRQSEQVQYVTSRKVETRIQSRSFEFSGVAFLGQMMARGTRPAGVSVQVLPSASDPLEPHTMNTTISAPIATERRAEVAERDTAGRERVRGGGEPFSARVAERVSTSS